MISPSFGEVALSSIPTQIDPGWATLFAALVGFLAIIKQTRSGFSNLQESQERQALLTRDTMAHQAKLDREVRQEEERLQIDREKRRVESEKSAMAAALAGELIALYVGLKTKVEGLESFEELYRQNPDTPINNPWAVDFNFVTPIYDSSIDKIGLLGPVLVTDIVTAYTTVHNRPDYMRLSGMEGRLLADYLEAYRLSMKRSIDDMRDLSRRLFSVYQGKVDPRLAELMSSAVEEASEK